MRGDILGLERRRRWSDEEKLGIVLSVGVAGATVTQVAQRHEVTRQQLYAWRHELKKKGLLSPLPKTVFLPMELSAPASAKAVTFGSDEAMEPSSMPADTSARICRSITPLMRRTSSGSARKVRYR